MIHRRKADPTTADNRTCRIDHRVLRDLTGLFWLVLIIAAILFSALPIFRTPGQQTRIVIEATGERNPASLGSQVWLLVIAGNRNPSPDQFTEFDEDGWEIRDRALLSYRNQPARLVWEGLVRPRDAVVLVKNPWSGKVRVTRDGVTTTHDLYSPVSETLRIELDPVDGRPDLLTVRSLAFLALVFLPVLWLGLRFRMLIDRRLAPPPETFAPGRVSTVSALILFLLLIVYQAYVLSIYPLLGDVHVYVAAISELLRDFANPHLEASTESGDRSIAYTPYLLLVAAFAKLFQMTPYRSLQIFATLNLAIFIAAVVAFFNAFYSLRNAIIYTVVFLVIMLFLRDINYMWSSELSFETLPFIQPYPSFISWATALLTIALAERYLRTGKIVHAMLVALLVSLTVLDHNITGSWTFGLTALRALAGLLEAAFSERNAQAKTYARPVILLGSLVFGAAATLTWPYYSIIDNARHLGQPELAPFSGRALETFATLFVLSGAALVLFRNVFLSRIAGLCVIYFLATYFIYKLSVILNIAYMTRYAFFMSFFAQVVLSVAVVEAIRKLFLLRPKQDMLRFAVHSVFLLVFGFFLFQEVSAKVMARSHVAGDSAERRFRARTAAFQPFLGPADLIAACPLERMHMDLFTYTGARFVLTWSGWANNSGGSAARRQWLARLFSEDLDEAELGRLLKRHRISKVLVAEPCIIGKVLKSRLGKPLATDGAWRLYALNPASGRARHRACPACDH